MKYKSACELYSTIARSSIKVLGRSTTRCLAGHCAIAECAGGSVKVTVANVTLQLQITHHDTSYPLLVLTTNSIVRRPTHQ